VVLVVAAVIRYPFPCAHRPHAIVAQPRHRAGARHGSPPKPLSSFIGRERELAQARRLLRASYLVTLTGPGGSGKTRLCIALAAGVAADFPDGAYSVPLAPVRDPGLRPYRRDLDVVTVEVSPPRIRNDGTGPVVLVRPDGYVAARGRLGGLQLVTGYLRYLLGEPAGEYAGERPPAEAPGR
jgi:hypothetical protein